MREALNMNRWRSMFGLFVLGALACALPARAQTGAAQPTAAPPEKKTYDEFIPPPTSPPGPSITLAEALLRASKRNLTILSTEQDLAQAEAKLYQAWALLMPVAQGNIQWMHMNKEISVDFMSSLPDSLKQMMPATAPMVVQPQEQYTGALQAHLPLVNLQNWLTIGLGKKGRELAMSGLDEARRQVLFGVTQVYYGALVSKSLITLWEDSIRTAARHMEAAKARFDAGAGLRIDVARAELDLESAKQSLITSRFAYDNARDALAVLIDYEKGVLPEVVEIQTLKDPPAVESMAEKATRSRNDLKLVELQKELAAQDLDVVWMRFLPTLDLNWQLNHNFGDMSALGASDRTTWATVMVLTVPIFEGFRYGMLDEKRAALKQADIKALERRLQVEQEVRQAYRDFRSSVSNVETAQRQVQLADEAMKLAEAAFEAGAGTSLDLIDAQKRHNDAGINLATQRLLCQLALIKLYQSAGEDLISLIKEK